MNELEQPYYALLRSFEIVELGEHTCYTTAQIAACEAGFAFTLIMTEGDLVRLAINATRAALE